MALRLAAIAALLLGFAATAQAAPKPVAGTAPTGLRGFLLTPDEPVSHVFSRTPSFAWNPVRGAVRYEFQLSTSNVFRDNGILFSEAELTSPAVSVPLTLPWITGNPYSLHARVRAVLAKTITPWSQPFGFNLRWETLPQPMQSYPGLLRWTPVDGAMGYEVWFVDLPKIVRVYGNVVDEREFYTFHQGSPWISTVRWRIRAVRWLHNNTVNGLPPVSYGPWSSVYTSVNPPFSLGAALAPQSTVSDVVANGNDTDPAHRVMPAFVFGGNSFGAFTGVELYRVYVFTDVDCVNPVFTGAAVGSPAYAPRPFGTLALPRTTAALNSARTGYLGDGKEGTHFSADFRNVEASESGKQAEPTTTLPTPEDAEKEEDKSSTKPAAPPAIVIKEGTSLGAPIDLWDTEWPQGGYYWTVVPVASFQPIALTTTLAALAPSGATIITVATNTGFSGGDTLLIGPDPAEERVVVDVNGDQLQLSKALTSAHGAGEPVVRLAANLEYRELALAQDVCATGRVKRFGKASAPAVTRGSAPFATGLSPSGRLLSASAPGPHFYGMPHVAWQPALGAAVYEVQWSKTRYPFRAEIDVRTGTKGLLTMSSSAILPLEAGTWYYRVRGINYSLPTGAQQMSWSRAAKLFVAKPSFRVDRNR